MPQSLQILWNRLKKWITIDGSMHGILFLAQFNEINAQGFGNSSKSKISWIEFKQPWMEKLDNVILSIFKLLILFGFTFTNFEFLNNLKKKNYVKLLFIPQVYEYA